MDILQNMLLSSKSWYVKTVVIDFTTGHQFHQTKACSIYNFLISITFNIIQFWILHSIYSSIATIKLIKLPKKNMDFFFFKIKYFWKKQSKPHTKLWYTSHWKRIHLIPVTSHESFWRVRTRSHKFHGISTRSHELSNGLSGFHEILNMTAFRDENTLLQKNLKSA